MKHNHVTLALREGDIEVARAKVEALFGIELEPHDSTALGDYYVTPDDDNEIKVWSNAQIDEEGKF